MLTLLHKEKVLLKDSYIKKFTVKAVTRWRKPLLLFV